jgi:hypothetical protein
MPTFPFAQAIRHVREFVELPEHSGCSSALPILTRHGELMRDSGPAAALAALRQASKRVVSAALPQ